MKTSQQILSIVALSVMTVSANAAGLIDLHSQRNSVQPRQQYRATRINSELQATTTSRHEHFIGLNADTMLVPHRRYDNAHSRNFRYGQSWRGIPIFGSDIVVSEDMSGNVRALFGNQVVGLERDVATTRPRISSATALMAGVRAGLGQANIRRIVRNQTSELVIFLDDANKGRLAYKVGFFADAPAGGHPTRPIIMIDAQTGAVLKQWENLQHAKVGTGYGGNVKTGRYTYGSGGRPYLDVTVNGTTCTLRNAYVSTVNLKNGWDNSWTAPFSYRCYFNSNFAVNGAYSPMNDAHYFGQVIYNMYKQYLGVSKPFDFSLVMKVHYGQQYENAFWNGEYMTFGDGANSFYPFVSLDVTSHEISHGFTEENSGLLYFGQSGGMNEAYSDIAGEAAEYFDRGRNDWMEGAEITKWNGGIRYFDDPTRDGYSIGHANNFYANLDVHYSSGVYNRAFYLLANKPGWGVPKAFKAFMFANRNYWTASSTFNQGACGVEYAAADLGYNSSDVTSAFATVGVKCATSSNSRDGSVLLPYTAQYNWSYNYLVNVNAGELLTVTTSGGTGNADLYVRAGTYPTLSAYNCRPYLTGNREICTFRPGSTTTYYIAVNAYQAFSGVRLTWAIN
ncbi:MAG: M4 family metallopeptidase [Thermomonas sp.]|nr:M4 family metallopeptidase [Thermomonas sp.]